MKLRFTKRASLQIDAALEFYAQRSSAGAERLRDQLLATTTVLVRYPHAGQLTTQSNVRRMVVATFPFVLFYRVSRDEIVIQRLFHTSRDPAGLPDRA